MGKIGIIGGIKEGRDTERTGSGNTLHTSLS
jgi:hypothetical protein